MMGSMTLTRHAVVICMGQTRDSGQCDADASKEAWFEFTVMTTHTFLTSEV
jgi:hypothetical protein